MFSKKDKKKRKNLAFSFEKIQKYVRIIANNYFNIFFMQNYTKIRLNQVILIQINMIYKQYINQNTDLYRK